MEGYKKINHYYVFIFPFLPGHAPNGVQAVGNGLQPLPPATDGIRDPMEGTDMQHVPQEEHAGHRGDMHPQTPPSPQFSNALPPEDQESLLHAHFSSSATPTSVVSSGAGPPREDHSLQQRHSHQQQQQQEVLSSTGNPSHSANFLSTFTQLPPQVTSQCLPAIRRTSVPMDTVPLLLSSHGPASSMVDFPNRVSQVLTGETSLHDVTQVTHSIHAPISSFTPLPNEVGVPNQPGGVPNQPGGVPM